jgi:hypothetical protein
MDRVSCLWFHLHRADVTDGGVATGSVIEAFDVGENITTGFLPCCIMPVMDELNSRATSRPEMDVSEIAPRHSLVTSSTMLRMRKRRPLANWS